LFERWSAYRFSIKSVEDLQSAFSHLLSPLLQLAPSNLFLTTINLPEELLQHTLVYCIYIPRSTVDCRLFEEISIPKSESIMKSVCLMSMFAVAAAFSPVSIAPTVRSHTSALFMAKKSSAPTIPNPLKALPWNARKEQEREARRLKTDSAKLHRELGIADDATFEEIQAVTNSLIANAEADGDVKKKIKVEVAKDRLMQIKLNARLAGLTELTEDAKAQSLLEEAE
jgi:hypothetical protein